MNKEWMIILTLILAVAIFAFLLMFINNYGTKIVFG